MASTFDELRRGKDPKLFLRAAHGTLYTLWSDGEPHSLVRRFDGDLPPSLARACASLARAVHDWVARAPGLAERVEIVTPTHVGTDFLIRPFHVYTGGTAKYAEEDDDAKPPPDELVATRRRIRAAIEADPSLPPLLADVIRRSLLEPAKKAYFDAVEDRLVLVEPHVTRDELERWSRRAG